VYDDSSLLLSTNILSVAVLDLLYFLVAKCTVCNRLYVVNNEDIWFFWVLSMRYSVMISPPIKNLVFRLYRCFKISSRVLINRLKSPVGALYKCNIFEMLQFLVQLHKFRDLSLYRYWRYQFC